MPNPCLTKATVVDMPPQAIFAGKDGLHLNYKLLLKTMMSQIHTIKTPSQLDSLTLLLSKDRANDRVRSEVHRYVS